MKRYFIGLALIAFVLSLPAISFAQTECTDELQASLDLCIDGCRTQFACVGKPNITLDEVRTAISTACGCVVSTDEQANKSCSCGETPPRNYGKFRSCAANALKPFPTLGILSGDDKKTLLDELKLCKTTIKDGKKGNNGNKGGNNQD